MLSTTEQSLPLEVNRRPAGEHVLEALNRLPPGAFGRDRGAGGRVHDGGVVVGDGTVRRADIEAGECCQPAPAGSVISMLWVAVTVTEVAAEIPPSPPVTLLKNEIATL